MFHFLVLVFLQATPIVIPAGVTFTVYPAETMTVAAGKPIVLVLAHDVVIPRQPTGPRLPIGLRPEHEAVLARAGKGWLEYVAGNIDRIVLYDRASLPLRGQTVLGYADYAKGQRVAHIAGNHPATEVAATLVHEAAHFEGITARGHYYDQAYAERIEARFVRALRQSR